jgi:hypothetical protein
VTRKLPLTSEFTRSIVTAPLGRGSIRAAALRHFDASCRRPLSLWHATGLTEASSRAPAPLISPPKQQGVGALRQVCRLALAARKLDGI